MGGGISSIDNDDDDPPIADYLIPSPLSAGFDYEDRVRILMARNNTPLQQHQTDTEEGLAYAEETDAEEIDASLTRRQRGHAYHKEHLANERVRQLMKNTNPQLLEEEPIDMQRVNTPPLSNIPLKKCPSFPNRGVSIRVLRHFAYELRKTSLLAQEQSPSPSPSSSSTTFLNNKITIAQVWELYIQPIIKPLDFTSLIELTDDVLIDLPTGLSAATDFGNATHFIVCNHDENYLTLADRLYKRFGTDSDGIYFWIDQFSLPLKQSERYPPKYFIHNLSSQCLSTISNIVIVLLSQDGFTSTTQPEWRKNGLLSKIECLVPLAVAYSLKTAALEILQDHDDEIAMRSSLLANVNVSLSQFDSNKIKSICLDDDYKRTKYFRAGGFFSIPYNETETIERHDGVDYAISKLFQGWLFIEAKALLEEQIKWLDLEVAKTRVGNIDLIQIYTFVYDMALLIYETASLSGMKKAIDLLQLLLKSSNEAMGSLSVHSVKSAKKLTEWLSVQEKWDDVEGLLIQTLAQARADQEVGIDESGNKKTKETTNKAGATTATTASTATTVLPAAPSISMLLAQQKIQQVASELSLVLVNQGRDEEAYPLLVEGYGVGACETIECLERRADKLMNKDKAMLARKLYGQIIKDCNEITVQHPCVLRAASIIADYLLMEAGDRKQAMTLYKRICTGYINIHGPSHFHSILSHRKVCTLLHQDQKYQEMKSYILIADGELPKNDGVVNEMDNAAWYRTRGDYSRKILNDSKQALLFYTKGLDVCNVFKQKKSSLALSLLADIGLIEQEEVHLDQAKLHYKRYLLYCKNDTTTEALRVKVDLAWVFTSLGQHANAEVHFRDHYIEIAKLHGDTHPLVNRARARLSDCLESQGRRDEALQLQHSNARIGHFQQSQVLLGVIK